MTPIHLSTPDGTETQCGRHIDTTTILAAVRMYATCGDCLAQARRHGHEGAVREHALDADGQEHNPGYGHGV
jgi:hypothetical protein